MSADTLSPPRTGRPPTTGHVLTGTGTLLRFMLRRDRIRLPAWLVGFGLFTAATAGALPGLYPTVADRQARATLMQNPGLRAIGGPAYGLDDYTFGAMIGHEFLGWIAIFVALMSIFTVVRHTRLEEETGRAELVRASRVGRHATSTAALLVAAGANVMVAAVLTVSLAGLGIESVGWAGSLLFGVSQAAVGVTFAAIAALTVQFTEHARAANAAAGAMLALAFTLRAAGDMAEVGGSTLSWLSPIGWAQQTRVYVDDRWWPLLLTVGLTLVCGAAAYLLGTRRDVGAGLLRARPGPAHAHPRLATPLALAWRLQRSSVAWWCGAVFAFALGYGTLAAEVERFVAEMSVVQDAIADLGGTIIDAWIAIVVLIFAVAAVVFAVLTVGRARSEESGGRAEPVLAVAVSRPRWLGSHLVIALAGSAALMALAGIGLGLSAAAALGEAGLAGRILAAALVHLPAVWLVTGIAVALYGVAVRAMWLVWLVVAYAGLVGWLGQLLQFPQWAINVSPLRHTPLLPAQEVRVLPLLVMAVLAASLIGAGLAAFRRRDLASTA